MKSLQKKYYLEHKERSRESTRRSRKIRKGKIVEIKSVPCMDCKQSFPHYVMDFDHKGEDIKVNDVSKLITRTSWSTILKEIEKCDIVCSNCHRIRTFERNQILNNKVENISPELTYKLLGN